MKITWEIFGGRFFGRVGVGDSVYWGSGAGWEDCRSSTGENEVERNDKLPNFLTSVFIFFFWYGIFLLRLISSCYCPCSCLWCYIYFETLCYETWNLAFLIGLFTCLLLLVLLWALRNSVLLLQILLFLITFLEYIQWRSIFLSVFFITPNSFSFLNFIFLFLVLGEIFLKQQNRFWIKKH